MKYTVISGLDRKKRPLGTLTVDGDKVTGFDSDKPSTLFSACIEKGETMGQLMGHYTNYVFVPEGEEDA